MVRKRRKKRVFLRWTLLSLAFLLFIILPAYMFFIEPRWIEVTKHEIHLPGLPDKLDGIKIAQISDLHRSRRVPDSIIEKTIGITNEQSPDIIAITGDFINTNTSNAKPCAEMLSKLNAKMGIYAVLGNHDHWYGAKEVTKALEANGIHVLTNKNREIEKGLFIIGIDDMWSAKPDVKRAWSRVRKSSAQILLSHTPTAIDLIRDKRCMVLTGHTHGGQVTIPFIERNKLPGLRGFKYISGWYHEGNIDMYVNRGIGMVMLPIRFRCRPEVIVITLRSKPIDR